MALTAVPRAMHSGFSRVAVGNPRADYQFMVASAAGTKTQHGSDNAYVLCLKRSEFVFCFPQLTQCKIGLLQDILFGYARI